jgi:ribonuclease BN (tRNA processing enzyme)
MKGKNKDLPELVILGSGTGVPSLRRGSPGLLIFSHDSIAIIDSGSGTLRRMLEAGVSYRDIDLLLYTHTHPDHVSDLVPILFASKYADSPRQKSLICIGGPGFKHYFDLLKKIYGSWIDTDSYNLTIEEVSEKPLLCRDLQISSKRMAHLPESIGYRIDFKNGKSITISGDTGYCRNIIELANETDLLVLECSFPNEKEVEGHLIPSLAGRIALESHCKKLMLTHLYPICDQFDIQKECEQVFKGEIIIAEDLMRINI